MVAVGVGAAATGEAPPQATTVAARNAQRIPFADCLTLCLTTSS
jgi:hypothetical protein